jgi:hypothetical protein
MRRFLRIRILFVLIALLLVPTLILPFAERLRAAWARYWEPKPAEAMDIVEEAPIARNSPSGIFIGNPDPKTVEEIERFLEEAAEREKALAKQERFLQAMGEIELPEFDEFDRGPLLSLPTEEYWAELKAREERRKAKLPGR